MASKTKKPDVVIAPPEHHETQELQTVYDRESIDEVQHDKLEGIVESLMSVSRIINDDGDEIDFDGETKDDFIGFFVEGYEIVDRMVRSIHETGRFLADVRNNLKPQKLFLTWLNFAGFPRSTAYNYLKLHDRYEEDLPKYSTIGVKKLLSVSKLKNCREYLSENAEQIAIKKATEVVEAVNQELKKRPKRRGGGRKPTFETINGFIVRKSDDGTKVVVEALNKEAQENLLVAIKAALLQINR